MLFKGPSDCESERQEKVMVGWLCGLNPMAVRKSRLVKKPSPNLTSHINTAVHRPSSVFLRSSMAILFDHNGRLEAANPILSLN
jgi:hypothetical protein